MDRRIISSQALDSIAIERSEPVCRSHGRKLARSSALLQPIGHDQFGASTQVHARSGRESHISYESNQGLACSNAALALKTSLSAYLLPMICMPTGKLPNASPAGIEAAG
jgi:hypothetical protein